MRLNYKSFAAFAVAVMLVGEAGLIYSQNRLWLEFDNRLTALENAKQEETQSYGEQIDALVKESKDSKKQLDGLIENYAKLQNTTSETIRQEIANTKSQDELLTDAVSKTTPSVVSIVITKDVPKLEVVYVDPFGNDPFFGDSGIRVPTYRQKGTEKQKAGAGTGFLITDNGYIITNRHVVSDNTASYTALLSDGTQKPAQVIYKDPNSDIAVVKVDGNNYKHVELGNSDLLKLGQAVFAVGNALGEYNNSVSKGIISGLNRDIVAASSGSGAEALKGVIQTDAAINPGNSGGPLVALDGKVVGINVATVVGSNNISFSIPINAVKSIISSVVNPHT